MRETKKIRKKKTDIHRSGPGYVAFKISSDLSTRLSYFRSEYTGLENIPKDGIVIFAPNHCNTLLDALQILRMRWRPTVFGARADLFNKPALAKFLRFLKILPMVRVRDGLSNVTKNYETMAEIYTVLGDGVPFCAFAEGTHRPMHSLLPMKKGIFRIALEVNSLYDRTVYVVPVGLEYGDYFRNGSSVLVNVGEAINVTEYVASNPEMKEAELYRNLLDTLHDRISKLITFIPDDENYQNIWSYVKLRTAGRKPFSLKKRLDSNRAAVDEAMDRLPGNAELFASAVAFDSRRKEAGISYRSLGFGCAGLRTAVKTLLTIALSPVIVLMLLLAIPYFIINGLLGGKIKDRAFKNSVRAALGMLSGWFSALVMLVTTLCMGHSYVLILCGFLAPFMSMWIKEWFRLLVSDYKLLFNSSVRKEFSQLRSQL